MSAVLFGSISTVADTSELQRAAFNQAFQSHGLGWEWSQDEYRELLTGNGGQQRIADYAAERGESVDAAAIHQTKSKVFQESLAQADLTVRPGVAETIAAARDEAWGIALVTTTSRENIRALLAGLGDQLPENCFDVVVDTDDVEESKPDPAAYLYALEQLDEQAGDCVAIEDNVGGVRSANAAGVRCVAFPNENTAAHDFGDTTTTSELSFTELTR